MAGFLQSVLGGALGGLTGGLPGALVGLVGGASGSGQHENPVQRQARLQQQAMANQLMQYAGSVPGSSPDELANMAQSRGLLGQQQRAEQQRVFGAYNPNQGLPAGQMLANLQNSNIAQQMAQRSSFLQDAAAQRRQALMQAAGLNAQAAGMYQPQQSQLSSLLGNLSQALAYRQTQRRLGQENGTGTTNATPGFMNDLNRAGVNPATTNVPPEWWAGGQEQIPGAQAPPSWFQNWLNQQQHPGARLGGRMGDDPDMTALIQMLQGQSQQPQGMMPMAQQPAAQGPQGLNAPGNEPFGGANATANAIRQSNGLARYVTLPNGAQLRF